MCTDRLFYDCLQVLTNEVTNEKRRWKPFNLFTTMQRHFRQKFLGFKAKLVWCTLRDSAVPAWVLDLTQPNSEWYPPSWDISKRTSWSIPGDQDINKSELDISPASQYSEPIENLHGSKLYSYSCLCSGHISSNELMRQVCSKNTTVVKRLIGNMIWRHI